jgi:hypothetical protein
MRLSATVVLLLGLAAPDVAAVGRSSPFPLSPGNRWQLRDPERGTARVVSVQRDDGGLTLHGFPGLGTTRVRMRDGSVEAFDAVARGWEAFLRLDAPAGTRYVVRLGAEPLWRAVPVRVASRSTIVRDARGRSHRNCIKLDLGPSKGVADAGVEELVFCPGVGLVRIVETTIAGPRTLLLLSARV